MGVLGITLALLALACIATSDDSTKQEKITDPLPDRPPFSLGSEDDNDPMPQDDPRVHMVLYPDRHHRRSRVQSASLPLQNSKKLEKEEMTSQTDKVNASRAAVSTDDQEMQSDDASRQMYEYLLAHDLYQRQALTDSNYAVVPNYGLSESQLHWINSLHPELRDRYLNDIYGNRGSEGIRAYAYVRRYDDPYRYYYYNNYYNRPYYVRQPVAVMVEDPVDSYDYSCYQVDSSNRAVLVRAPRLAHAHINRYDRRSNPHHPYNPYLTAMYRCNSGYTLQDPNVSELYCRKQEWVGTYPRCVPTTE